MDQLRIKGQRYTLLSARENLTLEGRQALKKLLAANRRLNTAYLLKESFGQLWSYRTEHGARAFFERWKQSLRWQRLEPYRKFAEMIERCQRRLKTDPGCRSKTDPPGHAIEWVTSPQSGGLSLLAGHLSGTHLVA